MHPDPRSGYDERSSQCARTTFYPCKVRPPLHHMLHAREAHWRTPVTEAPLLSRRSRCSDPGTSRARRPLIMAMRWLLGSSDSSRLEQGSGRDLAVLQIAPQGDRQFPGQGHDAHASHSLATAGEALVEPLGQGALRLQAQPAPSEFDQQRAHSLVAGLADALFGLAGAAVIRLSLI